MGLSLVYRIARDHGGTVRVESAPGRGSAFRIYLPALPEGGGAAASVPTAAPRGEGTVLVADDEEGMRRMAAALLSTLGYVPVTASDGEEAVRIFRERSREIDAVLLDLVMPRMDGREAMEEIRKTDRTVPVLLSSGYPGELERAGGKGKGFPFLKKPYGMAELGRALADALAGRPRRKGP